jgi:hypothetical protein
MRWPSKSSSRFALIVGGIFAACPSESLPADTDASAETSQIIKFLDAAFRCDPGWHEVRDHKNPSFVIREKDTNNWIGTDQKFGLETTTYQRMHSERRNIIEEDQLVETKTASWKEIGGAQILHPEHASEYTEFYQDKFIQVFCAKHYKCFTNDEKGDFWSVPVTNHYKSDAVGVYVCDARTREQVIKAIDRIVELELNPSPKSAGGNHINVTVNSPYKSGSVEGNLYKGGYNLFRNRDLRGDDLATLKNINASACESACAANTDCKGYSFDNWNSYCFLKSSVGSLRLEPRSTTGVRQGLPPPDNEEQCSDDQSCVAFTFDKKAQSCRMFESPTEYVTTRTSDSGAKRQAP